MVVWGCGRVCKRTNFHTTRFACSHFRMHEQRAEFSKEKHKAVLLEAAFRGYKTRKDKTNTIISTARVQIAIRSFLRNTGLVAEIIALHTSARNGDLVKFKELMNGENGNVLTSCRFKYDHLKSILQTVAKTGNVSMMSSLEPTFDDILSKDLLGNTSMHYAAGSARVEGCMFLSEAINTALQGDEAGRKSGLKKALKRLQSNRHNSSSTEGGEKDEVLCEGWLKKHKVGRGTDKRWAVLTKNKLKYFKHKADKKPTKVFDLESAMIKHSSESNFCFEMHSPLLLDKKNPHGRMYFECENEMMLQKWLAGLRASCAQLAMKMEVAQAAGYKEKVYCMRKALATIVKAKNKQGKTPLHLVAEHEPRKYKEVDEKRVFGKTAKKRLSVAHILKRQESSATMQPSARVITVATFLIESGCNIDEKDVDGNTAVKYAVMFKVSERSERALMKTRKRANLELKLFSILLLARLPPAPLKCASLRSAQHHDLAAALVRKGADMSIKGDDGKR